MIDKLKKWILNVDIEGRIFLIALSIATPYFGINIVYDFWSESQIQYLLLDSFLLLISLLFFFLHRNSRLRPFLMNLFSIIMIAAFIYYWMDSGGIRGGASYIFPAISVLVLCVAQGIFRYIFLGLFIALAFILPTDFLPISGEIIYANLLFEFFLNLIIIGLILIVFKFAVDGERVDFEIQNQQINSLNEELAQKSAELEGYNEKLVLMQQNLEKLIDKRTMQLHEEIEKDLEFSFINAHLVRAPIANILGITQHLDKNNTGLKELEENTSALDGTVRKIGKILAGEDI